MDRHFPELIRDAIASDEMDKAQLLWGEYAGWLSKQLDDRLLSERCLREASELVEWARQTVLAQKAHMRDGLNELAASVHVEQAYVAPTPNRQRACLSFLA